MAKYAFIDGERTRKAHSVRRVEPIFQDLAMGLARIPELPRNDGPPGLSTLLLVPGYP